MNIAESLLLLAFCLGMSLLGLGFCLWITKKAGIQPPEGFFWKIYRERWTGRDGFPAWNEPQGSLERGGSRLSWSRHGTWYKVTKKCAMAAVEVVVSRGHVTLEVYGDTGLLRKWESWQEPSFTVDLRGVKRVWFHVYGEGFTGSIRCAGRRKPLDASGKSE